MEPAGPPFTIVVCFEDARRERFLMARHARRGWELPGGRVEPGEDPVAGGVREFVEETGHVLEGARLAMSQPRHVGLAHIVTGLWGPAVLAYERHEKEAIREVRFVRRVTDVAPLAFPEDPYEEMGRALDRALV